MASKNTQFKKGNIPWNKNTKGIMQSPWNKGIKIDRTKYPNMGHYKKHSEESKLKMSLIRKQRISKGKIKIWNKGIRYIAIEGDRNPAKRPEVRAKIIKSKIGTKRSVETIEKDRIRGRQMWIKGLVSDKVKKIFLKSSKGTMFTKESRKNLVFPVKDTSIEVKIQNFLKQLGIQFFTHQYMKEIEHGYQCDIFIPSMNLVIECDGNYWHKYTVGKEIDYIRTKELIEKGFRVLRLWEFEIRKMDINKLKSKLGKLA